MPRMVKIPIYPILPNRTIGLYCARVEHHGMGVAAWRYSTPPLFLFWVIELKSLIS